MAKPTFDRKPIALKFDNFAIFKMASAGLSYGDFLLGKDADADKFCAAWAGVLGVEYNGDARAFLARFSGLQELNTLVLDALEKAGIIEPEKSAKKNKSR